MEHLQEAVGLATRAAVDSWKIYGKSKQKLEISQKQQSGIAEWKNWYPRVSSNMAAREMPV